MNTSYHSYLNNYDGGFNTSPRPGNGNHIANTTNTANFPPSALGGIAFPSSSAVATAVAAELMARQSRSRSKSSTSNIYGGGDVAVNHFNQVGTSADIINCIVPVPSHPSAVAGTIEAVMMARSNNNNNNNSASCFPLSRFSTLTTLTSPSPLSQYRHPSNYSSNDDSKASSIFSPDPSPVSVSFPAVSPWSSTTTEMNYYKQQWQEQQCRHEHEHQQNAILLGGSSASTSASTIPSVYSLSSFKNYSSWLSSLMMIRNDESSALKEMIAKPRHQQYQQHGYLQEFSAATEDGRRKLSSSSVMVDTMDNYLFDGDDVHDIVGDILEDAKYGDDSICNDNEDTENKQQKQILPPGKVYRVIQRRQRQSQQKVQPIAIMTASMKRAMSCSSTFDENTGGEGPTTSTARPNNITNAKNENDNYCRTIFTYKTWDGTANRWRPTKTYTARNANDDDNHFRIPLSRGGELNIFPNLIDAKKVKQVKRELLKSNYWRRYSIQGGDEPRLHFLVSFVIFIFYGYSSLHFQFDADADFDLT